MKPKQQVLFQEQQRFRQWYLWVFLAGITAFMGYYFFQNIRAENYTKNALVSDWLSGIMLLLMLFICLIFLMLTLESKIQTDGIAWRWRPFQKTYQFVSWQLIEQLSVCAYKPFREYGGWGWRIGRQGSMAYSVSGRHGISFIYAKSKEKILLGTQKPTEVRQALEQIDAPHLLKN